MELHVALDGRRDLSGQICRQLRAAILDGRLQPGQRIPSTRDLAASLSVARNTVGAAYDRLTAEGLLTCRGGVGTYVSPGLDHGLDPAMSAKPADASNPSNPAIRPRSVWDLQPNPIDASDEPEYDFRPGLPDSDRFPYPTWRALVADALRRSTIGSGAYIDPAGHPGLRAAIARHLGVSRGVAAGAGDVLVTNGIQQAIDLVCRVLLEPGDVVAVEDPGWPPPRSLFQTFGARVTGVPVDGEGLVVDELPDRARLVYVSPSHQFPLGVMMSPRRRLALLEWAERANALIVEDDYDSEFRFTGRPVDPLRSLDRSGRVMYVGSFSKSMLPMLRLGFCLPPPTLKTALYKAKYLTDWHTELPMQIALAQFIERGLLARHVRRQRRLYEARRNRILAVVTTRLAGWLEPMPSVAGLHIAARLRVPGADDHVVAKRVRRSGGGVSALSEFAFARPTWRGFILGYGRIPVDRIDEGLRRLERCLTG